MSGGPRATVEIHPRQSGLRRVGSGLGAQRLAEIQRARLIRGMGEMCAERGALNVTVAHVVERAGVSRRTFYEIFEDREDCFQAAFGEALARAGQYVEGTRDGSATWIERIRSALQSLLLFLEEEPVMGRLLVVEALSAGPVTLRRRREALARLVEAVDGGRPESSAGLAMATVLTAEGVVGGAITIIYGRMLEDTGRFLELINPLMSMIVLPYLGATAAREELERSVSETTRRAALGSPDPLKGLDMRLTYRTVRVLGAVASRPKSSNRLIAETSGVSDQGQISKLLGRLEKLGLIENEGAGVSVRGEPNAWVLSRRGEEVHDALASPDSDA